MAATVLQHRWTRGWVMGDGWHADACFTVAMVDDGWHADACFTVVMMDDGVMDDGVLHTF